MALFKLLWLENLILNKLPAGEEVQIMSFSRSKIGPKLEVRKQPPQKMPWTTFFLSAISFFLRHTWSMMSRAKLGVYSCPSLHISENQEYGQDPRHQFCPKILQSQCTVPHSFHFFLLHFFSFFSFSFFSLFWFFWFDFFFTRVSLFFYTTWGHPYLHRTRVPTWLVLQSKWPIK